MPASLQSPIQCVGVICFRNDDVLLIRRGTAPRKGEWSIPGGRIEDGETQEYAALRELSEETGVTAILGVKIAIIEATFEEQTYCLHDYSAEWLSGDPVAADDACDAKFVPIDALSELGLWPQTQDVIEQAYRQRRQT